MNNYKIKYWCGGDIKVCNIKAPDKETALYLFYMEYTYDDVISVVLDNDV